jgi:hypothetical protein
MSETPVLDALEHEVRAQVCRDLAVQLDAVAELVQRVQLDGWAAHFGRDAQLLRLRADQEDTELVVQERRA